MKTIAIVNQKGGVGKTTTCQMLAAGLRRKGYSVLMVDCESQGNLTAAAGASRNAAPVAALLQGERIPPAETPTQGPIYTSTAALSTADLTFTDTGKEYRLREALDGLPFDYCIIDTPPALGILTVNALTAADAAIVPAQASTFSLQGIGQLSQTVAAIKKYCNPALTISGILITMYNSRAIVQRETAEALDRAAQQLGTIVFKSAIRPCNAIGEAQTRRLDIFTHSPRSNAAKDYAALTDEVIERI